MHKCLYTFGPLCQQKHTQKDRQQQQLALLKSISAQKPESHQYKIDQLVPAAAEVVRLEVDVVKRYVDG